MHLIDLLHQKIELFRLEQRYTRRRNRRSTFVSEAQYVDGEYIYSNNSAYSGKSSAGGTSSDSEEEQRTPTSVVNKAETGNWSAGKEAVASKPNRRLSKMGLDWRKSKDVDMAPSRASVREVRWDSRS
jgi:hypothetical protein